MSTKSVHAKFLANGKGDSTQNAGGFEGAYFLSAVFLRFYPNTRTVQLSCMKVELCFISDFSISLHEKPVSSMQVKLYYLFLVPPSHRSADRRIASHVKIYYIGKFSRFYYTSSYNAYLTARERFFAVQIHSCLWMYVRSIISMLHLKF